MFAMNVQQADPIVRFTKREMLTAIALARPTCARSECHTASVVADKEQMKHDMSLLGPGSVRGRLLMKSGMCVIFVTRWFHRDCSHEYDVGEARV